MGIIWSHVSLAETTESVALRARQEGARGREVGEETNWTRFRGLPSGREVLMVLICNLHTHHEREREREVHSPTS